MSDEIAETIQTQEPVGIQQNPFARLLELHSAVKAETQGLREAEQAAREAAKGAVIEAKAKYDAVCTAVKAAEEAVELPHRAVSITRVSLEDAERAGLADRVAEIQSVLQQALPELKRLQLVVKVAREERIAAAKVFEAAEQQFKLMQKPVGKQVQQPTPSAVPNPHTNLSLGQILARAKEVGAADEGWKLDGLRKSVRNLSLLVEQKEGWAAVNAAQNRVTSAQNRSRQGDVMAGIETLQEMLKNTPCELAKIDLEAAKVTIEGDQIDWLTAERLVTRGLVIARAALSGNSLAAKARFTQINRKSKK